MRSPLASRSCPTCSSASLSTVRGLGQHVAGKGYWGANPPSCWLSVGACRGQFVGMLIHHAADHGAADVRPLLRAARQAVLAGVCVLFSRVVPLDCKDPSVHPLWQLALKVRACGGCG